MFLSVPIGVVSKTRFGAENWRILVPVFFEFLPTGLGRGGCIRADGIVLGVWLVISPLPKDLGKNSKNTGTQMRQFSAPNRLCRMGTDRNTRTTHLFPSVPIFL